jgi:ribonuclease III
VGLDPNVGPDRNASEDPAALDRILGVRFLDDSLLEMALTHRSFAFENGLPVNNERLEFLGDGTSGSGAPFGSARARR